MSLIPDGRQLTPHEREILEILQEEAAEVIQAASKMLRFGHGNTNPSTGVANDVELGREVGDLRYMIGMATNAYLIDVRDIVDGQNRKCERLKSYMLTKPEGVT